MKEFPPASEGIFAVCLIVKEKKFRRFILFFSSSRTRLVIKAEVG
jgi:hypothetical protein